MEESKKEKIPVKVSVIETIYNATLPIFYRLNSLLKDVQFKKILISDFEKALLLEQTSHVITLKNLFEELLEEAKQESVLTLYLENLEFKNILYMSKTVELSYRLKFGQTGIWSH
jgi:hypothetical protein